MAIMLRAYIDICQVGDGAGTALLGQLQSNEPGYGAAVGTGGYGAAPSAQTLRLQDAVAVPGGDVPSNANFTTAFTQLATELGTLMNAAGAYSGGTQTPLQIVQLWNSGGV
jgi:hypothetical protein